MHYYLVGFMGSGKSYWANVWAAKNGYDFVDLDKVIEEKESLSVLDLFEQKGEEYFRVTEAAALRDAVKSENTIISCGGGTPCFYDNMDWMNLHGTTIYLSAPAKMLLSNIMGDTVKRPLVKNVNENELLYFVQQTLANRIMFYEKATFTLVAGELTDDSFDAVLKAD